MKTLEELVDEAFEYFARLNIVPDCVDIASYIWDVYSDVLIATWDELIETLCPEVEE